MGSDAGGHVMAITHKWYTEGIRIKGKYLYEYRKLIWKWGGYVGSKAVNIYKYGKRNNIQLSVQLLGFILIDKGSRVEQEQIQRFLVFIGNVDNTFLLRAGVIPTIAFGLLLDLERPKCGPTFAQGKQWWLFCLTEPQEPPFSGWKNEGSEGHKVCLCHQAHVQSQAVVMELQPLPLLSRGIERIKPRAQSSTTAWIATKIVATQAEPLEPGLHHTV